jgi:hypothetical protein
MLAVAAFVFGYYTVWALFLVSGMAGRVVSVEQVERVERVELRDQGVMAGVGSLSLLD